jgi:hypothetical protein
VSTQVESQLEPTETLSAPTRIVGIGASAGGLESLEQLFANLPSSSGMAFVVVQHLSPDFRSVMDELLGRFSDMPVRLAEHGALVRANHVYLLPACSSPRRIPPRGSLSPLISSWFPWLRIKEPVQWPSSCRAQAATAPAGSR